MSTNTLTKAAPRTATIRDHLEGDAFKKTVAAALPKHLTPERFIRVALTAMTRIPKLANCEQASFFQCLLTLSALGLEPDGRRAHLIPFENKRRGVTECQLIVDWKGLVELAMRSGSVANLHADTVSEGDVFDYSAGKIKAHIPWFLRRDADKPPKPGEVFAAYAIAEFKDGTTKAEVMALDEIEAIRSRSRAGQSGPWVTDWNEMAKKTVFRRLSKWLPLSPEYRDELDKDADVSAEAQAVSIVSSVNSPFNILEESTAGDGDSFSPKPPEQLPQAGHGEDTQRQGKSESGTPAVPSIKEQLANAITGAGYTFDEFTAWGKESGMIDAAVVEAIGSFDEVPQALAVRLMKSQTGMLNGIKTLKATVGA